MRRYESISKLSILFAHPKFSSSSSVQRKSPGGTNLALFPLLCLFSRVSSLTSSLGRGTDRSVSFTRRHHPSLKKMMVEFDSSSWKSFNVLPFFLYLHKLERNTMITATIKRLATSRAYNFSRYASSQAHFLDTSTRDVRLMKSICDPNPFTTNAFAHRHFDVTKFLAQKRLLSSQQMPPFMNQQQKPGEALAQYSTDLVSLLMMI